MWIILWIKFFLILFFLYDYSFIGKSACSAKKSRVLMLFSQKLIGENIIVNI